MEKLEKYLVEHCAPTLASLKTANLFACPCEKEQEIYESLNYWNHCMREKGIRLCLLRKGNGSALVYVYRRGKLEKDLSAPTAFQILQHYGYETPEVEWAIVKLRARLAAGGNFPHEIGLFLGYPPEDVIGFIRYGGRRCKCTGCWKVYDNEQEAKRTFAKFDKCRNVYMRLWQEGRSVMQLTVAV